MKFKFWKLSLICFSFFIFLFYSTEAASTYKKPKHLLHFVQITDTHLSYKNAPNSNRLLGASEVLLRKSIDQINKIPNLDFVIFTGDLVDFGDKNLVNKFIEITKNIKYPTYVLLGNHEMYKLRPKDGNANGKISSDQKRLYKKDFVKIFSLNKKPTGFLNKKSYYAFYPNNRFKIICLDLAVQDNNVSNGNIPDEELKWLEREIKNSKKRFIIIASHFPIIEPFRSTSHDIVEPGKTNLLKIINKYPNVIGYFTGHYHTARLTKIKNKIHNSCPAIVEFPNAFREVTIFQNEPNYLDINFKFHTVDLPELVQLSKISSVSWALTNGNEEDRNNTIKWRIYKY